MAQFIFAFFVGALTVILAAGTVWHFKKGNVFLAMCSTAMFLLFLWITIYWFKTPDIAEHSLLYNAVHLPEDYITHLPIDDPNYVDWDDFLKHTQTFDATGIYWGMGLLGSMQLFTMGIVYNLKARERKSND